MAKSGGRRPDPVERKRARGNPGRRPLPDAKDTVALEPAGAGISELGLVDALELSLSAARPWLAESDAVQVGVLREAIRCYNEACSGGETMQTRLHALKQVETSAARLGLNPGERGQLGLAEVKARSQLKEMKDAAAQHEG